MTETNHDIEEQRRLARDWKPDVDGPLVGPVSPTTDFTADFPSTDPRHEKIKNLAADFPHYRSMKRDGSCGYRALAYGFLFNLCRSGSGSSSGNSGSADEAAGRLKEAAARFDSLQDLFGPRGWDAFIYEDWLAACVGLCDELASTLLKSSSEQQQEAIDTCAALLERRLNDEQEAGVEVLQYLRAVTSSWMLAHEADFAPFVVDEPRGVQGWCELNVDPPSAEMEEQSLLAFYQAVVMRSGMSVHVHYLEQSAGDRLHVSSYEPAGKDASAGKNAPPAVHLLYRP